MSDISESMFFSDFLRPFFNGATFDFNGLTTTLTDKVMMMALATKAIDSFTIVAAQYIDNLVIDQTLQGSIDSCETNALAFALHQAIDLLSASETASTF
jgi:hypothetical protein